MSNLKRIAQAVRASVSKYDCHITHYDGEYVVVENETGEPDPTGYATYKEAVEAAKANGWSIRPGQPRVSQAVRPKYPKKREAMTKPERALLDAISTLYTNASLIPDPQMSGAADCYRVTLDDMDALLAATYEINVDIVP